MNEIVFAKIKKLLSLSKSDNSNEAELALQKAVALATEAGIDLAVVEAREQTQEEKLEMVQENLDCGARLPTLQKYASWLLEKHFGVKIIYSGHRFYGRTVRILGDKKDVEFAKFVNEFIQDDMQRRWEYYKRANNLSVKYKQTFMYNVYLGLSAKLSEAKKNAETSALAVVPQDQRQTVESRYALALSSKQNVVEAFVAKQFPKLTHARPSITNFSGSTVARDGYTIGTKMEINRPLHA